MALGEIGALLGRVVAGKFAIEEHVGGGAMGEVFRARHIVLDTPIALKIMRADIAKDAMFKERFYREAKAASRLDHPNSVRVLDFGVEEDGLVYLAMEYLAGRDLLSVLREEWPLPDARVVDVLVQTLGALSVAHDLGIVHRDLKPENIMVTVGPEDDGARPYHVKVCDFGIAKLNDPRGFQTDSGKALTSSGTLIGTPEYMSPEQARGDSLDARSDLYSIGVVLYQLLVGKVPFTAENALGVVLKQVTDEPVPPSKLRPGVNARLEAICLRALKKPREERYQTAKDMRRDLRGVFGYRPQSMTDESGGHLPPVQPESDPNLRSNAATLVYSDSLDEKNAGTGRTLLAPVVSVRNDGDFSPKQTSDGTELTVPVTPTHRYVGAILGVAVVALLVGAGAVVAMSKRDGAAAEKSAASAAPPASGAPLVAMASAGDPTSTPPLGTTAPPLATGTHAHSTTTPKHAGSAGGAGTGPKVAAAGASAGRAITTTAAGGPGPAPSVAAAAAVAAPAPSPAAASDSYNAAGAYVALGALSRERVREDVLRAKMSAALPKLTDCYRSALMMAGAPVAGSAEIHMSIDDKGNVTTIVNAPKHPAFARCAQGVLGSQKVPLSALEGASSMGATATQWLSLHP